MTEENQTIIDKMSDDKIDLPLHEVLQDMMAFKCLIQAMTDFNNKFGISAKITFTSIPDEQGVGVEFSFSPRSPTRDEWNFLLEGIMDLEKIFIAENVLQNIHGCDNINQVIFRYKEEANLIVAKNRINDIPKE